MSKHLLFGNEAFARGAWEAGVTVATGYPGTPSTEILEFVAELYKNEIYCEWSPNEKVAFEVAAGAALAGARAMATMKHVGLNVAADPLMTLAYTGVVGGFVAVVADDPGMHSSQNEQDTRRFAQFAKIPILEPADSQEAKDFVQYGLEISEKFQIPVILRSSTRISHSRTLVELGERKEPEKPVGFVKDPPKYVAIPVWARQMRVRLEQKMLEMRDAVSKSPLNRIEWRDKKLGIVTSGVVYQYVREAYPNASVLKLGWSFPFPDDLIQEFAAGVEKVLVAEELEDFFEEHLKALGITCSGKNILPNIGELSQDILSGTSLSPSTLPPPSTLPSRPPVLCAGCPHRGIFYALGKFDVVVVGDIGCYSLGTLPPLSRLDTLLCMGAGVSMAQGMDKAKNPRKVVGMVGDSTFFHSGITGLLDVAYNKGESTIIVVDNRTTAMTGHQDHPGSGLTLMGEETVAASIAEIGKAVGVKNTVVVDPRNIQETVAILKTAIESPEPWLIVSESPCPLHLREPIGPPLAVDYDNCKNCGLCLKLGCPGLEKDGKQVRINSLLCAGCKMCQNLCPTKAIVTNGER